jgi:lipoprotein-anchoring transpeptidase ErfK/SrfK
MLLQDRYSRAVAAALTTSLICATPARAQRLAITETPGHYPNTIFQQVLPSERDTQRYARAAPVDETSVVLPAHLRRQIVNYPTREAPGTIVIDTPNTYLYYVLGNGRAVRYGIGVGREGFTWAGVQKISNKQEWPDWHPPADMIARQPYLPRFMSGGPGNPLGARAMYLGNSLYRIHGTNAPSTIGQRVSSGCIRLTNEDVADLYNRVALGAKVVVLNDSRRRAPADVASVPVAQPAADAMARYERRHEEPAFYAPRPQMVVPTYEDRPYRYEPPYRSADPYFGGSASRIY